MTYIQMPAYPRCVYVLQLILMAPFIISASAFSECLHLCCSQYFGLHFYRTAITVILWSWCYNLLWCFAFLFRFLIQWFCYNFS